MQFAKGYKYTFIIESPTVGEFCKMADRMRELRLKNEIKMEDKFSHGGEGLGFIFCDNVEKDDTEEESAKD